MNDAELTNEEYEDYVSSVYKGLVSSEQGTVFRGKEYVGKSGHRHAIDVSIELRVAGVDMLIFIECKRYRRRIEVGEVLEFSQRLSDVSAHKGILVTTTGFQEGAFKVAKSQRIALIVASPYHDRRWECVQYCQFKTEPWGEPPPKQEIAPESKPRKRLCFNLNPRNFSLPDDQTKTLFFEQSSNWPKIINALLANTLLYPHDYYAEKIAAEEADRLVRYSKYVEDLNNEAKKHSLAGQSHIFTSGCCSLCGCSIHAIRDFKWWQCKKS